METKVQEKKQPVFKGYDQNQSVEIRLCDLFGPNDLARVVDDMVERLEMGKLEAYYPGGGSPAYHPKMMLKVWLYGYCTQVYTSRRLAAALRHHVAFMYLAGKQQPCFKTLSDFRSKRLGGMIDVIFKQVLCFLVEAGYIKLEDLYVDGSKWEANANRHKIVWAKNTARYKAHVEARVAGLLQEAADLQQAEDVEYGSRDLPEAGPAAAPAPLRDQIRAKLTELQQSMAEAVEAKARAQALRTIHRALDKELAKLLKYEAQERVLGDRNSYARTDPDATALRMKDDQLRPGYNVQHTTEQQFILNYTIEQTAADAPTLPAHLDKQAERLADLPTPATQNLGADAGYGSEENYAELEKRNITAYVKYPGWFYEQRGQLAKAPFRRENFPYNAQTDTFTCPQNRTLYFVEERQVKTSTGYERTVRQYACASCANCPVSADCKKSDDKNRTIHYSPRGEHYKRQANHRLASDQGRAMRSARSVEVESAFGDLKHNMHHRRFSLRGLPNVYIEFGLLAISHNLRKIYCQQSGIWAAYYAQRAQKRTSNPVFLLLFALLPLWRSLRRHSRIPLVNFLLRPTYGLL